MLTKEEINQKLKTQKSRLKYFRKLHGLTIDKVCRDNELNRSTYTRMERDPVHKGTIGTYLLLAEYYGASIDYIIGNDVEPTCMANYINKRTMDELAYKKKVYDELSDNLIDEGLDIDDLTEHIINLLKLSEKEIDELHESYTVIPKIILHNKALRTYPYNLLSQIFGTEALQTNLELTHELINNLDDLLDRYLNESEAYVLKLRFINEMKLEDIAKTRNVTKERIRQIEAKAIRRLRHVAYTQTLLQSAQIAKKKSQLEFLESQIEKQKIAIQEMEEYNPLNMAIDQMNLTVRSYSALKGSGVLKVLDILNILANKNIFNIRNIGVGSVNDIINNLQKYEFLDEEPIKPKHFSKYNRAETMERLKRVKQEILHKYTF